MESKKKELINRYLSDRTNPPETALVDDWFTELKSNENISERELDTLTKSLDKKKKTINRKKINWTSYSIAASIIATLLLISVLIYNQRVSTTSTTLYTNLNDIIPPINTMAVISENEGKSISLDKLDINETLAISSGDITRVSENEYRFINRYKTSQLPTSLKFTTKNASMASISFEDGTRISVNENSSIIFKNNYLNNREVQILGEAYFAVQKLNINNIRQPFIVLSKNSTIEVLGTKFNIIDNHKYQLALQEGKVSVVNNSQLNEKISSIQLKPNQIFNGKDVEQADDINTIIAWTDDQFSLNNKNLSDFSKELSAWYGIKILIDNNLNDRLLYGSINRRYSLQKVLEIIDRIISIDYELDNNVVNIRKKES